MLLTVFCFAPGASGANALAGDVASISWMLGRWDCAYTFASDGFHSQQEAHVAYSVAPGGAEILKSVSGTLFGTAYHGRGTVGYDAARKVWYQRNRSDSGLVETLESHDGFTPSMRFEGTDGLHAVSVRVRQAGIIDPRKSLWNLTNQEFYSGVWRTTSNAVCLKSL
jgi:hypothetical protein